LGFLCFQFYTETVYLLLCSEEKGEIQMKYVSTLLVLIISLLTVSSIAGMPPDIQKEVKSRIAAKYPDNYSLQKTLIDGQISAYNYLQTYAPRSMPRTTLEKVKANISSKYPYNYSLQKTLIEGQVSAYEFIQSYFPRSMPADVYARVKNKIESRYPYNYSLQKTLIEGQVKSYSQIK